jgi:putative ABC transport system permease protein
MDLVERIEDSVLAQAIPLYVRFQARGFPVVGTSLDYFEFRELRIADGRAFAMLGECVIGAEAARSLSLRPGDSVVSSPETVFDLAGVYPLKMKVAGILEESGSPDDRALFVDVKTTWVMQGLVHGHQDLATLNDPTMVVKREDGAVTATAKLYHYNEITKENVDSFHVHGDPATYPLTAVLARPHDDKSAALLRGRYVDASTGYRIAVPTDTVSELLERIFRIKRLLQGGMAVVAGATLLALVLVFSLSLRLRQRELHTLFKLGAARGTVFRLVASEIAIITLLSACLSAVLLQGVAANSDILVRTLVLS